MNKKLLFIFFSLFCNLDHVFIKMSLNTISLLVLFIEEFRSPPSISIVRAVTKSVSIVFLSELHVRKPKLFRVRRRFLVQVLH